MPKAADIVGLYKGPPDNAVVLSVDEKPSIQALERAQGYLKLPNGRAMIGQSHDYKRNGTTTLFAALNVGTGEITGRHYKPRRRLEFLDFMNRVVKQYQGKEIHVVLDNLSTHKPKRDLWRARHPNVHFHYTPTHTSWLNQIEIWFSILSGKSLKGGIVRKRARTYRPYRYLHRQLQRRSPAICLDQERRPSEADETMFRGLTILGTRACRQFRAALPWRSGSAVSLVCHTLGDSFRNANSTIPARRILRFIGGQLVGADRCAVMPSATINGTGS